MCLGSNKVHSLNNVGRVLWWTKRPTMIDSKNNNNNNNGLSGAGIKRYNNY